ncbi:hypothetical protein AcW1_001379 [Taiwanofungus camphoratus]|nr:hypothetical protein AcW1_001379 [Antrodia cinnamomea]
MCSRAVCIRRIPHIDLQHSIPENGVAFARVISTRANFCIADIRFRQSRFVRAPPSAAPFGHTCAVALLVHFQLDLRPVPFSTLPARRVSAPRLRAGRDKFIAFSAGSGGSN